jgi:hypothetical protein
MIVGAFDRIGVKPRDYVVVKLGCGIPVSEAIRLATGVVPVARLVGYYTLSPGIARPRRAALAPG